MAPTIRQPVFDAFWHLAAERQLIFHKRAAGQPGPWTDDPILRRFKFCNAYRASDRVSQYLIRHAAYDAGAAGRSAEDTFLRIILFRLFSKEATWDFLERETGGVSRESLNVERLGELLDARRREQSIYTGAFILCAHDAYGHTTKHRNHLELVKTMFRSGGLGRDLARARSLAEVFEALTRWPMIGNFMGYQLAVDLNYSDQLDFDEDSFTVPGPGAVRGLQKVFSDFGGARPADLISLMVQSQDEQFGRLGLDWQDLFGRPLHAIDCQNLFCETDKYAREAFPELKSNRSRIKQGFSPHSEPLALFYPPKWGINGRLSPDPRTSAVSAEASCSRAQLALA